MKTILVTGGTVFVSRYIAEYYVKAGHEVYVLNRNTKKQSDGVKLIQADRSNIGNALKGKHFDIVIDTAYSAEDVSHLLDALESFDDYIFISSSAVYPETNEQPFKEDSPLGRNNFWGKYGTDKIEAEKLLQKRVPGAYILRPPYLYGPMNNVYREAFVFECALAGRKFYLPKDGQMKLQFLHIEDLCKFMNVLMEQRPNERVYNVGNSDTITMREWVELCYRTAGSKVQFKEVHQDIEQRDYFSFYNYEYKLDVTRQHELFPTDIPLEEGLKYAFVWYTNNKDKVVRKDYIKFIDENFHEM